MLQFEMRSLVRSVATRRVVSHKRSFSTSRAALYASGPKKVVIAEQGPLFLNEASVRDHKFLIDEPESEGGQNKGPTPFVFRHFSLITTFLVENIL